MEAGREGKPRQEELEKEEEQEAKGQLREFGNKGVVNGNGKKKEIDGM